MTIINDIDAQKFSFNGVEYFKNFTPVVVGNKIRVLNTYDSSIELTSYPTLFSDFELDGNTFLNVADLQSALLPVLFTRDNLGGGGVQSVSGSMVDNTDPLNPVVLSDNTKQDKVVVVSSSITASNDQKYHVVANATFTDPSPVEGKGYEVFVRNGVATIGGTAYPVGSYVFRTFHSGSWGSKLIGDLKKSFQYNTTSLCIFNFPATSNWVLQSGNFGMGAYGSARSDAGTSNFLTLITGGGYGKAIGGIAPYDMKLTENLSVVTADANLIGGDLKLVVGYIELNYSTGVISNATIIETGTYTPLASGRTDLRQDFTGGITIPKGAIWCYSWAHTKTSAVSSVYIQTILNFEQI